MRAVLVKRRKREKKNRKKVQCAKNGRDSASDPLYEWKSLASDWAASISGANSTRKGSLSTKEKNRIERESNLENVTPNQDITPGRIHHARDQVCSLYYTPLRCIGPVDRRRSSYSGLSCSPSHLLFRRALRERSSLHLYHSKTESLSVADRINWAIMISQRHSQLSILLLVSMHSYGRRLVA